MIILFIDVYKSRFYCYLSDVVCKYVFVIFILAGFETSFWRGNGFWRGLFGFILAGGDIRRNSIHMMDNFGLACDL